MQITRLLKAPYTEFSFFIVSAVTAAEAMDLQLHMYICTDDDDVADEWLTAGGSSAVA